MTEKAQKLIRYNHAIQFKMATLAECEYLIAEHRSALVYSGDNFLPTLAVQGQPYLIVSPFEKAPLGVFVVSDKVHLGLAYIRPPYKYLDRQILEAFLDQVNIHYGFVASFDPHMIPLYLAFMQRCELQAYQFELLYPDLLPKGLPGVTLNLAQPKDVPYLDEMGFLTNSSSYVRRQEIWIAQDGSNRPVGIGIIQPHQSDEDHLDLGMFVNPNFQGRGIGRSIVIRLMEIIVQAGRIPVAGCFHKNFESRRTLESAGMTCIGTIFRVSFNKDRFR